jgi:hypothetical protein
MKTKRNHNSRKKDIGIKNLAPIIESFTKFSKGKSLYKEINKYGYKLFSLSSNTINLIKTYGPENIRSNLEEKGIKVPEVIKNVGFKKDSAAVYDKTRRSAMFYRIEELKEVDISLYDIVMSIMNEIKEMAELHKWFEPSNIWNEILFITLSFLISIPCDPTVKNKDGIQGFHIDYPVIKKENDDGTKNEYYESNYPLSVVIALQDDTFFRLLSNSHKQYDNNGFPNAASYNCKVLKLSMCQLIIFHPNLIHSGNKYHR